VGVGTGAATVRSVYERLFFVKINGRLREPYKPRSKRLFDSRMKHVRNKVLEGMHREYTPFTNEEFLATYKDSKRKRDRYSKAADSFYAGRFKSLKQIAKVRGFLKREKLPYHAKGVNNTVLRLVSPRNPMHAMYTGRYLKKAEQQIKLLRRVDLALVENGASTEERSIFKGLDGVEQGYHMDLKRKRIDNAVFLSFDASRYDQHVSEIALKWEHGIYEYMFPRRKHKLFHEMLDNQLKNTGSYYADDGSLKVNFEVEGGRMSGDMNTSLGNCLLMTCMTKAYMDHLGIKNYGVANNGDDTFVVVSAKYVRRIQATLYGWFRDMGFKIELEKPVTQPEQLKFCQGRFFQTDGFWVFSRDPLVAMTKDSLITKVLPGRGGREAHIAAIGECGLAGHACVPVMHSYYRYMTRFKSLAKGEKQLAAARARIYNPHSGDWVRSRANLTKWYDKVDDITRISFFLATGWTPQQQRLVEEDFACSTVDTVRVRSWLDREQMSRQVNACRRSQGN
jgi:hypothetical protein